MVEDISIDCICMSVEIERHTVGSRKEEMKVIAQKNNEVFLIQVSDDPETSQGIIANEFRGMRFPQRPLQTIFAQGYWEDCEHSDELLKRLMSLPEDK